MAKRQDASTGQIVDDGKPEAAKQAAEKPTMQVKVHSPFQVYYDEQAYSVSGENKTGPFDILPHHHNFISLLDVSELVIRAPSGEKHIRISGGLMHVKADNVVVFLDV